MFAAKHVVSIENFFPGNICAVHTYRTGGRSAGVYSDFNLATHVGDELAAVIGNRSILRGYLPRAPIWLNQAHTAEAVELFDALSSDPEVRADAAYTASANVPCTVLTADCLPILVYAAHLQQVAAIHAGWRGLLAGVIQSTIDAMSRAKHTSNGISVFRASEHQWYFWFGPSISRTSFEVGQEVRDAFLLKYGFTTTAFSVKHASPRKWHCDLYKIAVLLIRHHLDCVSPEMLHLSPAPPCTFQDPDLYFSYRRDGVTGRMASVIYRIS